MDFQTIFTVIGACAASFVGTKLLVKGDNRVEDRRRRAVQLASWCSNNGLPILSQMLASYSIGDYSGVLSNLQNIGDLVADPAQAQATIDLFLTTQLGKKLSTVEGKEQLISAIEKSLNVKIDRAAITQKAVAVTRVND